jgi:ParB-like chromosome segregation protein Spo0J
MIRLGDLHPAPWNANRMTDATRRKVRASIETFGVVENLVARPRWCDVIRNRYARHLEAQAA